MQSTINSIICVYIKFSLYFRLLWFSLYIINNVIFYYISKVKLMTEIFNASYLCLCKMYLCLLFCSLYEINCGQNFSYTIVVKETYLKWHKRTTPDWFKFPKFYQTSLEDETYVIKSSFLKSNNWSDHTHRGSFYCTTEPLRYV